MSESSTNIRRPRISEILETQVEFYAPAVQTRRRTPGRVLARFVTLMLLLIVVIVIAGQTVVATPTALSLSQIGTNDDWFRSDSQSFHCASVGSALEGVAILAEAARRDSRDQKVAGHCG